jgi:hypothetical protein
MAEARDHAKVTNYLAQQVMESNGKSPEIARSVMVAPASLPPTPTKP